jgi:hypothetical protein
LAYADQNLNESKNKRFEIFFVFMKTFEMLDKIKLDKYNAGN